MANNTILVVDDSALMRKHLSQILEDAGYEVETARNGEEALEKIAAVDPAVVTLDINMPVMDGITCLSLIMQQSPRPVVMVSSLTEKGALVTFEALELGALDYVAKPGGTVSLNIRDVAEELLEKVRAAKRARIGKSQGLRQRLRAQREKDGTRKENISVSRSTRKKKTAQAELVIIGVSTGGPGTLEEIITALPAEFPVPVVIAQHMPARFTQVFAERLNKCSGLEVVEINRPVPLLPGQVLIAKGDADVKLTQRAGKLMVSSIPASDKFLWHPSVERLAQSVKELCDPETVICVQLTGMGNDGAKTMAELHELGARTIAESEETAVVYGMPRELVDLGGADCVLPSNDIAGRLIEWVM